MASAGLAGCQPPLPPAAATNLVLTEEEKRIKATLTPAEQARLEDAFRQVAAGQTVHQKPTRAPARGRWSDLRIAVSSACADTEMAVVKTEKLDWGYRFHLKTIDDRPGELIVRREADDRVYSATATIGRFDDDPERVRELLAALDRWMKAFGRKRSFQGEP